MIITDEPTPCYKRSDITDEVIERRARGPYLAAVAQLRAMCNACPVRDACHTENAEEDWCKAVTRRRIANGLRPDIDERRAKLHEFIARGYSLPMICEALDTTRKSLFDWCARHGEMETYQKISGVAARGKRNNLEGPYRRAAWTKILESGGTIKEACEIIGINRKALMRWCRRNNIMDQFWTVDGRNGSRTKAA